MGGKTGAGATTGGSRGGEAMSTLDMDLVRKSMPSPLPPPVAKCGWAAGPDVDGVLTSSFFVSGASGFTVSLILGFVAVVAAPRPVAVAVAPPLAAGALAIFTAFGAEAVVAAPPLDVLTGAALTLALLSGRTVWEVLGLETLSLIFGLANPSVGAAAGGTGTGAGASDITVSALLTKL